MKHKNEISKRSDKELNRWNADTSIDRVDDVQPCTSQINTATVSTNIKVIAMKLCFKIIKIFLSISTFYSTRKNYTSCCQEIVFNQ